MYPKFRRLPRRLKTKQNKKKNITWVDLPVLQRYHFEPQTDHGQQTCLNDHVVFHCVYTILVFAEKRYKPNTLCIYVMLFLNLGNYSFYFGEGNGTPLQYSCLKNPMDRGAWWAAVHGVVKSRTRLSDFTLTFHFHALEKEMATHSSVLAWRIPGTGEPVGLRSMGSHRVRHD